jgi:hypothetical protein
MRGFVTIFCNSQLIVEARVRPAALSPSVVTALSYNNGAN